MKKRFLLGLLPAVLALSGCTSLRATGTVVPNKGLDNIVEDTEAHDEVFGKSELAGLGARRAIDVPDAGNAVEPVIGIQTKTGVDSISIRFVAAIKVVDENKDSIVDDADLALTEASWVRSIYQPDGTPALGSGAKESTKAYTSIAAPNDVEDDGNDDDILTIADFNAAKAGRAYTHFIVYTLLDLPLAYSDYYISVCALVFHDKHSGTPGISKELVTTIDQKTQFTFEYDKTGYFGVKKTASGFETINPDGEAGVGNLAAFSGLSLSSGESVVFVNRVFDMDHPETECFEVFGYEKLVRTNPDFEEGTNASSVANNTIAVKHNGTYTIYYNNKDEIIIDKKIYFEGPWWWEGGYESWINLKHDDGGSGEFKTFAMTATGVVDHQYYAFVDISYYTYAEFYRKNGEDTQNWTGMKLIPTDGKSLYKHAEADGGGGDNWY